MLRTKDMKVPIHVLLVMTRGASLSEWAKVNALQHELTPYKKMSECGMQISIISWGDKREREIARSFPWLKVYGNFYNLPQEQYEWLMPFLHALPLIRADVVKSNQINGADCALRCARIWGKPFVSICRYACGEFCLSPPDTLDHILRDEREVLSKANACIVNQEAGKYLISAHTMRTGAVTCIPNYIPDHFFQAPLPDYSAKKPPVITLVGRLVPQKNIFALIEACSELDISLQIIGDGPEREALADFARDNAVKVEFVHSVTQAQLPSILCKSTICTLVSHYEDNPKSLLEYMACGCPVLATNVPSMSTFIEDHKNGLLCSSDPASIRTGLNTLLENEALRRNLGKNARITAKKFSLDVTLNLEQRVYEKIPRRMLVTKGIFGLAALLSSVGRRVRALFSRTGQTTNTDFCDNIVNSIEEYISMKPQEEAQLILGNLELQLKLMIQKSSETFLNDTITLVHEFIAGKSPDEALRLLFSIEEQLYPLEGKLAIAYDGGVHSKHRLAKYHDFFVNRIQHGEKVIDVGCGVGFLAYDMAEKAQALVTGIELSGENIAIARGRFSHPNITFIQGNAVTDIQDEAYDTVVLSNVLEHLPNRITFLAALRKKLRPKRFLLCVPIFERDWRVPLKKELGIEWRLDPTHETEYTYESFVYELSRAGLTISYKEFRWGKIWCEATDRVEFIQTPPQSCPVTVLMACHNDRNYVEKAIISILQQTMQNFLFLIIDDASTDGTSAIIAEYARNDARISIITNDCNIGLTASLNKGLQSIETPYIVRMDADDIAFPERIEFQLSYMKAHTEIAAAGCHLFFFDDEGHEREPRSWKPPSAPTVIRQKTYTVGPELSHPGSIISTSAIKAVGGYRTQFASTQDYDLWLRLLESYELGNVPCTLMLYRQHDNAISQAKTTEQAINHVLALQSSEYRRKGESDPLEAKGTSLALLLSLLDPLQPSFYVWLKLLASRPIHDRSKLLFDALYQLTTYNATLPTEQIGLCKTFLEDYEWKLVMEIIVQDVALHSMPAYTVVLLFLKDMMTEQTKGKQ